MAIKKMSEERKKLVQEFLQSGDFKTANDVHDAIYEEIQELYGIKVSGDMVAV